MMEGDQDGGTLLLRAPSTRPNDIAVSLRAPSGCPVIANGVATLAMDAKCPPAVAERVRSCILHSGRYDCRISAGAAFYLIRNPDVMAPFGASVVLTEM